MSKQSASWVVAAFVLAACAGPSATPSSAPTGRTATPSLAVPPDTTPAPTASAAPTPALPVAFASTIYDYSLIVPAGWVIGPATVPWDAASAPSANAFSVDKFVSPSGLSAFAYAGAVSVDLAGFVRDNIAWTFRDHGSTCPDPAPEITEPIEVGGEPGVLLLWDCGILINSALLVRDGTGFVMVMRDINVKGAKDAADRAILEALLDSIDFVGS